jgi:hypothetical protein
MSIPRSVREISCAGPGLDLGSVFQAMNGQSPGELRHFLLFLKVKHAKKD